MHVLPYLFFNGRCEEALAFYSKTIGAKAEGMMRFSQNPDQSTTTPANKDKVMHAQFKLGDSMIFVSDGMATGKTNFDGFSLAIAADSEADAKQMFGALGEGGAVTVPLSETFFAKSFGMLKDRFGVSWMLIVQKVSA